MLLQAGLEWDHITEIGSGGPRGTLKTYGSCMLMVLRRMKHRGSLGLMLRLTAKSAERNLRTEIEKVHDKLGMKPKVDYTYDRVNKVYTYHRYGNSEIHFGFIRDEDDYLQYQGLPYLDIAFEEAPQHKSTSWQIMSGSNRPGGQGQYPKQWGTANPGNAGQGWWKRKFVNASTREETAVYIETKRERALAMIEQDPGYWKRLRKNLTHDKARQWVDCDWEVQSGQYFAVPEAMVRTLQIPPYSRWYAGVDWGYWPDPFAYLAGAKWKGPDGRQHLHILREYGGVRMDPDVQAKNALKVERKIIDDGYAFRPMGTRYADPTVWRRQEKESTETGRTVASMWAKHGFSVTKPRTPAHIPAFTTIRTLITHGILTIDPACRRLIDELTDAVHEGTPEEPGEDMHPNCDDHFIACLRYLTVSIFGEYYEGEEHDPYDSLLEPEKLMKPRRRRRTVNRYLRG